MKFLYNPVSFTLHCFPSQEDFFATSRLVSVLSTDSEPKVVRETGLEELFEGTKKRGTGRLLNKLANMPRPASPDSLGRVTPLAENTDSGLDSGGSASVLCFKALQM